MRHYARVVWQMREKGDRMTLVRIGGVLVAVAALSLAGCVQQEGGALWPASQSPQQPAAGDDALTLAELVQLEVYLKQLGSLAERVDGEIGASTRAAIGAYQQANGHRPTGSYTHELLAELEESASARVVDGNAGARPSVAARTTRPAPPVQAASRPATTPTTATPAPSATASTPAVETAQAKPTGTL